MYTPARMQLQMTSVLDENVHCIAVQGTFDDCQVRARTHARSLARVLRMHAQV
jgi:threonine synthase